jgi:hypothetical protein
MNGALYRPTAVTACGTATAADDSRYTDLLKGLKRAQFQTGQKKSDPRSSAFIRG